MMPCISSAIFCRSWKSSDYQSAWEISFYTGLIFLTRILMKIFTASVVEKGIGAIIDCTINRDWDWAPQHALCFQKNTTERAISYITRNITPAAGQIPFIWRNLLARPQIPLITVFAAARHEIYLGKYRRNAISSFYEKMAREYQVSVSTMRRTALMCSKSRFRAVGPVNGIRSRVCPAVPKLPISQHLPSGAILPPFLCLN